MVLSSSVTVIIVFALLLIWRKLVSINEDLATIKTRLVKAKAEIVAKLEDLEAQLANLPESVDPALVADLKDLAAGLDDVVPDAVVEPEPEPTPEPDPAETEEL